MAGWPPSRLIEPQPAAARQPTPRPGCVQDLALKRIQSRVKDVDLRSGCRSSSSLIKLGRNRSTCSGGASPWLRGGTGLRSRGLCRLCWTLLFTPSHVAARCLQSGCLPLHWDGSESRGGKGCTQICQEYLAISLLTPDPQPGCVPRGRTETVPESILVLKPRLWGS